MNRREWLGVLTFVLGINLIGFLAGRETIATAPCEPVPTVLPNCDAAVAAEVHKLITMPKDGWAFSVDPKVVWHRAGNGSRIIEYVPIADGDVTKQVELFAPPRVEPPRAPQPEAPPPQEKTP